jgi:hypothetical protein
VATWSISGCEDGSIPSFAGWKINGTMTRPYCLRDS